MPRNNQKVEEIFSAAWEEVLSGRSIESVVTDYPDYAVELEPMLRLTKAVRALSSPTLSPSALSAIQQRTEDAVRERRPSVPTAQKGGTERAPIPRSAAQGNRAWRATILTSLRTNIRIVVPALAVVAVLLAGVFLLRPLPPTQTSLESYSGVITQISASGWRVGETEIVVDSQTKIHGQPIVGARMVCIGENLPGRDRMRANEVWIGIEPSPPLTAPTRSHEENSLQGNLSLY